MTEKITFRWYHEHKRTIQKCQLLKMLKSTELCTYHRVPT